MVSRIGIQFALAGLLLGVFGCLASRVESDPEGVDPRYVSAFKLISGYDSLYVFLARAPQPQDPVPLYVHPQLALFRSPVWREEDLASPCLNPDGWSPRSLRDSLHRYTPGAKPASPSLFGYPSRLSTARAEFGYSSRRSFDVPFVPVIQFSEPYRNLLVADVYNNLSADSDLSFVMGTSLNFTLCFDDAGAVEDFWVVKVANQ